MLLAVALIAIVTIVVVVVLAFAADHKGMCFRAIEHVCVD